MTEDKGVRGSKGPSNRKDPCLSPTMAAWTAGIVDGEGCLYIQRQLAEGYPDRKNDSYAGYLKVTMCHKETIERLHTLYGGANIKMHPRGDYNDAYTWLLTSKSLLPVLKLIRPYLCTKANEADLMLEFLSLPLARRGGKGGGDPVPPELLAKRERLWLAIREAKPTHRYRKANKCL